MEKVLRAYFSFDYERDLYRVRKLHELPDVVTCAPAGFQGDHVWLQAKRRGDLALKGLMRDALNNTSVSVFCVGHMCAYRKFVDDEVEMSLERGNGLLGLLIHDIRDQHGRVDPEGHAPDLITLAGFQVHKFTTKRDLVTHIRKAHEIAAAQQRQGHHNHRQVSSRDGG